MRVLTVGVLIFCAPALVRPLAAEELLVQGMGRTVGWVVATSDGQLAFRDCGGRLLRVRDGRIERAKRTCPAAKRGRLPVTRAKVRAWTLPTRSWWSRTAAVICMPTTTRVRQARATPRPSLR